MAIKRNGVLRLDAAARRLRIPQRTLRYKAARGRIQGAFREGKLWMFIAEKLKETDANGRGGCVV